MIEIALFRVHRPVMKTPHGADWQRQYLPMEILGMATGATAPALYALGLLTTVFSFMGILCSPVIVREPAAERVIWGGKPCRA